MGHVREQGPRKEWLLDHLFAVLPLMHFTEGRQVGLDAFSPEDQTRLCFAIGSRPDGVPFNVLRHSFALLLTGCILQVTEKPVRNPGPSGPCLSNNSSYASSTGTNLRHNSKLLQPASPLAPFQAPFATVAG